MASGESGLPDSFDPVTARNIKWVARLGSETHATPVIAGGRIFIGTNNGVPRDPQVQGDRVREPPILLLAPVVYWPSLAVWVPGTTGEVDVMHRLGSRGDSGTRNERSPLIPPIGGSCSLANMERGRSWRDRQTSNGAMHYSQFC